MKPATRNTSALTKLLPAYLLVGIIVPFAATEYATAGHHHFDAAAQRVSGCIDGVCGTPVTPYGHFQGSWRRWPTSQDTPLPANRQGTTAREPFIPEVLEEGRTRPRTRSDRPLDPEDMGAGAGVGSLQPGMPGAMEEANPFNNTVDESDIPTGAGSPSDGSDEGLFPPADNGAAESAAPDPIFESGGFDEPDDGAEFGLPGGDTDSEPMPDLFDQSGLIPAPPAQQVRKQGAIRSIKSRGVSVQTGLQLKSAGMPALVIGPEISLPTEDSVGAKFSEPANIDLVSFENFESVSRSAQMPQRISKLSDPQVTESEAIPQTEQTQPEVESATGHSDADSAAQVASKHGELRPMNPLRIGTPTVRHGSKPNKTSVAKTLAPAAAALAKPKNATSNIAPVADSRTLSQAVASRSLRDTLRKNPLRR